MKVLCCVAHPDDECLLAGGTLAKHAASGDVVNVMTFTDGVWSRGYAGFSEVCNRRKEWFAALKALGVHATGEDPGASVSWYSDADGRGWMRATSYLDQELDMVPMLALSRHVSYGLEKFKPDVVYTHWPVDLNQDHRRVAEAVLIATRLVAGSTVRRVLAGEVPESTHQAFGAPAFSPTVFVSLDEASAERKCRALACYVSESRPYPHPRSVEAVEERMRMWGGLAGVGRSEAFVLLREVVP